MHYLAKEEQLSGAAFYCRNRTGCGKVSGCSVNVESDERQNGGVAIGRGTVEAVNASRDYPRQLLPVDLRLADADIFTSRSCRGVVSWTVLKSR
jgi:hypothetical protein